MRILASIAAAALLAACATPPPSTPAPVVSGAAPAPQDDSAARALAGLLSRAGATDAPTQEAVERALGAADVTRRDGAGAALTYRLESCALMLLFTADQRNAMRLAQSYPGPRRTGDPAPSLQQCAQEALARGARGVS